MAELAAYLGIGIVVGFLSGLLGIGGGVIIVSALALMFAAHDFPPLYVMHLSIATSMACIVFGSWSSFRTHQRHDGVNPVIQAVPRNALLSEERTGKYT